MINIGEYFNYAVPMTGEQMTKYQTNLTAVSLFAGVGGFDLAVERNGVKVVASAEIDKHARFVLARHFPNATQYDDVRKVTADGLRTAGFIPERGIITGGFPCQDLSVAGKRAGLAGARSGLFYKIARIADETKAKWLVLENVPGLLSSQRGADMGAVVGTLVDLGYGVAWRVLDAQHFGVPQRRRRVFIVAERSGDPARCAQVLFERQGVRGNSSQGRAQGQENTRGAVQGTEVTGRFINRMTAIGQYAEDDDTGSTLLSRDYKSARDLITEPTLYEPHHGDGRATTGVANTLAARMGTGDNNTPVLVEPSTVRRLTPTECERLQGFPDGWTEGQADSHRYKQMGNAVAVPVVEWVIQGIVEVMSDQRK